MRIAMLLYNTVGRGTYWRALYLARGLARQGYEVSVVATSPTARRGVVVAPDSVPGVQRVTMPDLLPGGLRTGWDVWNIAHRLRWVRRQAIDLVHAFEMRPAAAIPALALARRGVPLITDWCDWFGRGGSVEERTNPLLRAALRPVETFFEEHFRARAAGTTVINTTLQRRAEALGIPADTILHLPNGSNTAEIQPEPRDSARAALDWPLDVPVVGYIGAMFERDAVLMAEAFNALRRDVPNARLLLAGYANVAVERRVDAPDAVIRTGPIAYGDIGRLLSACDVCWLPLSDTGANRGRTPLKLNDYMAVGKPIVATRVGDVPAMITRANCGLVVAPTADALATGVRELLYDRARAATYGQNAHIAAQTDYNWDTLSQKLAHFYARVLENS